LQLLPGSLRRLLRYVDPLSVAPEALEAVELPRRGCEDVEDEIEVVDEHPLAPWVPFDECRLGPTLAERFLHAVGDSLR
jgi:hypothetical protein